MDSKKLRALEITANVAILVVALLVIVVVMKRNLLASEAAKQHQVSAGERISVPGIDWTGHDQTMVLALSKGCHFCSESAPFYNRLAEAVRTAPATRLVAVLPQEDPQARQYLKELGLTIDDVNNQSLSSVGVLATPTILLVDKKGVVKKVWVGELPPEKQSEVLKSLTLRPGPA